MRILVTGAAGFVGSALCRELARHGHEIIATDNFSSYYSTELKRLRVRELITPLGIDILEGDLAEPGFVASLFCSGKPIAVIHLAAQAGVRIPKMEQDLYVQSNLVGFSNVIREASLQGVQTFLYASSSSVYGEQENGLPFKESELNLNPNSFYGSTKLCNEIIAKHEGSVTEMRTRGMRFFTAYGPWGRPDMAYFRMISSALNATPFHLYGDGSIKRDFTFVDDIINSVISLLEELHTRKIGFSDIVNVGGGNPVSMTELLETVRRITKINLKVEFGSSNPSDSSITWASTDYLKSLIGNRTFTKLEEGISKTLIWATQAEIQPKLSTWARSVK